MFENERNKLLRRITDLAYNSTKQKECYKKDSCDYIINEIKSDSEYKVEIKTLGKNYKRIEELITKNHKYEVPEIISYKLNNGSKKYLNWMKKEIN